MTPSAPLCSSSLFAHAAIAAGAAGSLAGAASAQLGAAHLDVKVSLDGAHWSDQMAALPGDTVHVVVFGVYRDALAFGSCSFDMVTNERRDGDGIAFQGTARVAPFDFGGTTVAVFATASTMRLDYARDADNNPLWGISCFQAPPSLGRPGFTTDNPAKLLAFDYHIGGSSDARLISVDVGTIVRGRILVYHSMDDSRQQDAILEASDNAVIAVIPAPATLLAFAAPVLLRRRR